MSISYEEALATLQAMFGEPWTRESLDAVLRHYQGHMENTVECILGHGDKPPQQLIDNLKSGRDKAAETAALDEQLARALSQGQAATQSNSRRSSSGDTGAAPASGGGSGGGAPNNNTGRGAPTTLSDDFLRIPNRKYENDSNKSNLEADEALARMLQDELFSEELARNPDFAHLAGRKPRTSSQTNAAGITRSSNVWNGSGFPARNGQQPQSLPNIMEKLSEMGNSAKSRLQLMAAQFKANNERNAAGGFGGNSSSPAREMRGLLDGDDYDTMELASRKDL